MYRNVFLYYNNMFCEIIQTQNWNREKQYFTEILTEKFKKPEIKILSSPGFSFIKF